jgi:hypothetical protein
MASKTIYRIEDGAAVLLIDSIDAKEYVATGRYSFTPPEPVAVPEAPVNVTLEIKKGK